MSVDDLDIDRETVKKQFILWAAVSIGWFVGCVRRSLIDSISRHFETPMEPILRLTLTGEE
jgi:hypothetical protein